MKRSVLGKMNKEGNNSDERKGKKNKRIILEGSEDESDAIIQSEQHNQGVVQVQHSMGGQSDENQSTELQVEKQNTTVIPKRLKYSRGSELIRFNKNNLNMMLQDLNDSISRRGFKVSSDGHQLVAMNTNIDEEINVSQQVQPPCPFVTTRYFDTMVVTGTNTDPDGVVQIVMDCAKQFCEALLIQERVILLEEEIRVLKKRQISVWSNCKRSICDHYPYEQLRSEDKELFFNTALLGKSFIPNLIHARALAQLLESNDTHNVGFYGISRLDLLSMSKLSDDSELISNASILYKDLQIKLRKIYNYAYQWIHTVEECIAINARSKLSSSSQLATAAVTSIDQLECPSFVDFNCSLLCSDAQSSVSPLDYVAFNRPLITFRLSAEDKDCCFEYLQHPDSDGCLYPPAPISQLQQAFLMESNVTIQESSVKHNKKFGSERNVIGQGIFNGPGILPAGTELLYMGVIYHGVYDEQKMEEKLTNVFSVLTMGPDSDFKNRILEIKKDAIYILGYQHLITSLINEAPSVAQNGFTMKSEPSIGLLYLNRDMQPYEELTLHYGTSIVLQECASTADSSSKRTRSAPQRYEPISQPSSKYTSNQKKYPPQPSQDDTVCSGQSNDGESVDGNVPVDPVQFFQDNQEDIVAHLLSLGHEKLQSLLGVTIGDQSNSMKNVPQLPAEDVSRVPDYVSFTQFTDSTSSCLHEV